jgi:hypothetical protein
LAALEEKKSRFHRGENLPKPPVQRIIFHRMLTRSIALVGRLLCCVLHSLSESQKVRRVELALS